MCNGNGTAKQNGQEELEKLELEGYALSSLLQMYPKINPGFLNSKFVEFDGNLEKITNYIQSHNFSQKKDFLKKAKGKKGQPMAEDNDPQPSSYNGTAHQNGQEKPAKKAKLEKGYPKAANKDPPQPSPINGTAQQNGQEKLAKKANLEKGHHKAANKDPLPSKAFHQKRKYVQGPLPVKFLRCSKCDCSNFDNEAILLEHHLDIHQYCMKCKIGVFSNASRVEHRKCVSDVQSLIDQQKNVDKNLK